MSLTLYALSALSGSKVNVFGLVHVLAVVAHLGSTLLPRQVKVPTILAVEKPTPTAFCPFGSSGRFVYPFLVAAGCVVLSAVLLYFVIIARFASLSSVGASPGSPPPIPPLSSSSCSPPQSPSPSPANQEPPVDGPPLANGGTPHLPTVM